MKKLLLALACSALLAPAALACPGMHHDDQAPKTAENKDAPAPQKKDEAKAKDKDQKPAQTDAAKTKDGEKKPDKVSAK